MATTVYLGIGSNSGDRHALIERAVAALVEATDATCIEGISDEYVSAPWGFESDSEFLNIVVALRFDDSASWDELRALRLLDDLQSLEKSISSMPHRNPDGSYRDREIDIDIILIPGLRMQHPRLTIPHPLAVRRPFVTIPLSQLLPTFHSLL